MGTLKLNNIRKSYGQVDIIKGIDLDVRDGELVVFVGPSGCGKSTLLRIIAGLEDANSGEVRIDDQVVNQTPPAKRGIAMVFQSYALYPHLTVEANMGLGLKQAGKPAAEINERVTQASGMLSLESYLQRRPAELSGGQRQRVAIGRALVREPKLFLFDEPLSNLDAALRVNTRLEIAKLHRQLSATMIYVTHDQVEAMTLADRIVVLNAGKIEQVGAPMDLYNAPDNEFVAGFIGSPKMNFVDATALNDDQAKRIGIRPEHITLDTNSGQWKGSVVHVEQLGADTNVYLDTETAGLLTVRIFGQYRVEPGTVIYATPESDKIHRFDGEGRAIR
ncbi:ABC transporter ATP-binding protein [Pseudochrobactrum saccharolyticum]|uniref:Multiple sugar transport system ATP-binding protein n=1 Tax=Pseudochrobactrum saccharolyticum TaxID=354352 RepID=A0A7W8AIL3_9HYPH|nr:ATP-binding cassette domain-containing protein [Pseudochrobactrum saccharolyticum]KAB0538954.1 ATP-binding cassette domain-containing protein [Pseudochrobactrum saccharolyticum]MBB5091057.1 multiple sugar transport system ATP-binding protein [Pseudochrobactrum saccharolyticum]MDP8249766.1 ATP-binding cassette domain-containing protein [Pseudochrobactrum saccharolyticum]